MVNLGSVLHLQKSDVILAPTNSDLTLLTAQTAIPKSPLCGNYQLFQALMDLYKLHSYHVLSISKDAIVARFVEEIEDPHQLAEQAIELFPFLPEYHTAGAGQPDKIDVNEIVADDIRNENAIHIIYHSF